MKDLKQEPGRRRSQRSKAKAHEPEGNGANPPAMLPTVHRADGCAESDGGKCPNDMDDDFDLVDHLATRLGLSREHCGGMDNETT